MSNNTPTAARPTSRKDSHWYTLTGEPCYEITGKTTGKPRPVNLGDAKKQNLYPGFSTVAKIMHKEALVQWLIEQACLAVLTSPRLEKEELDAFVKRILQEEKVHEQEAKTARDKGTEIHDALQNLFTGQAIQPEIEPWVRPAFTAIAEYGSVVATEKVLIGEGYGGRTDLIQEAAGAWIIWDFKSTKKLPDPERPAWLEHRCQLAAYAMAYSRLFIKDQLKPIQVANCYISTLEEGKFVIIEHDDWPGTYWNGFVPMLKLWCFANNYTPVVENRKEETPVKAPSTKMVFSQGVRTTAKPI